MQRREGRKKMADTHEHGQQSSNKRAMHLYCKYHRDHGHDINNCRHLKEQIDKLSERAYEKRFIAKESELKGANGGRNEPW